MSDGLAAPSGGFAAVPSGGFAAAVLCGGRSRRFGRDKALVELDGRTMAERVADALRHAGALEVVVVGGEPAAADRARCRRVPDRWPEAGPLGGIISALSEPWDTRAVVICACDLPDLAMVDVVELVAALERAAPRVDVAVAIDAAGREQWVLAAWSTSVLGRLESQFAHGVRAPRLAVSASQIEIERVPVSVGSTRDVDTVAELEDRASGTAR